MAYSVHYIYKNKQKVYYEYWMGIRFFYRNFRNHRKIYLDSLGDTVQLLSAADWFYSRQSKRKPKVLKTPK